MDIRNQLIGTAAKRIANMPQAQANFGAVKRDGAGKQFMVVTLIDGDYRNFTEKKITVYASDINVS